MGDLTFDAAHFDALYRENSDPWAFRSSAYEREKYAATLAALPQLHYRHVLELGSSIGELTVRLAERAERVTGVETSAVAIGSARQRCVGCPQVQFVQAHLPDGPWAEAYDAVVLSEVLYYLTADNVAEVAFRLGQCAGQADLVLVHWTGPTNYPLSGDAAAERFIQASSRDGWRHTRTEHYRLDVWTAGSPRLSP